MRRLKFITIIVCLLLPTFMTAQDKSTILTLENLIPGGGNYAKYRISFPTQIQWWGDVSVYLENDELKKNIKGRDEVSDFLLNKEQLKVAGWEKGAKISFPFNKEKIFLIENKNTYALYNFGLKDQIFSIETPSISANHVFSKKIDYVAYTKDNNLYVMDRLGHEVAVSDDENKEIVSGQAVHRSEFGIHNGIFWSPKGSLLAFYRMDETMVTDYPLVNISARVAKLNDIKYPMAGMKSHHVTVGIFNPITQKVHFLKTGLPKEKYLTNIGWSPDEKYIYIAEVNRGQDTCHLVRYEVESGRRDKVLFVETDVKYVEPEHPVLFVKNNPANFIWQSKRDGYNHLYLYNLDGSLKKQLTSGDWDVTDVFGFDSKGKYLYFISTKDSPIEKHIYSVNLVSGAIKKISKEAGVHRALLSASGSFLLDIFTAQSNPGKITLINLDTGVERSVYEGRNPFENILLPEISLGKLKADDDKTDLYYRMVKPLHFDTHKKYPVIVYVYGGPHSQLVENSWLGQARGWDIYMAQKGYIVFTLDNRGTTNRGKHFENIVHCQLGVVESKDQMTGVEFLKSLPYVDVNRIGVHGWSFGGFMTLNLMLRYPDTFKVGVAGGPVTDWQYYEIMYGERYMDSPQENPTGYKETSMVKRAGNLKGRLMLIHGDEDPTVVMQHSLQFLKSAIKKGTHPDFFIYPGHGHNMIGADRVHLQEHITRYFENFLK